jgi:hypothetical protein
MTYYQIEKTGSNNPPFHFFRLEDTNYDSVIDAKKEITHLKTSYGGVHKNRKYRIVRIREDYINIS